jgi:hypothetical protein
MLVIVPLVDDLDLVSAPLVRDIVISTESGPGR